MLGRGVAERLAIDPGRALLAPELEAVARDADVVIVSPLGAEHARPARGACAPRRRRAGGSRSDARRRPLGAHPAGPARAHAVRPWRLHRRLLADSRLRNDVGLLWLITLDADGPLQIEGVPLKLEVAHTRRASRVEATLLLALLEERCTAVGSTVQREGDRLVFYPR
jgi:hypothetical protein